MAVVKEEPLTIGSKVEIDESETIILKSKNFNLKLVSAPNYKNLLSK